MSNPATNPSDCCQPCSSTPTTQVPGPIGPSGNNGNNGTNGVNAYTTTTASFIQPAVNSPVSTTFATTANRNVNEYLFINGGGYYILSNINSPGSVTLTNIGGTPNASPGSTISSNSLVTPSGQPGATGSSGVSSLNAVSPTTTKGDLMVDNGNNSPAASVARLAVGSDGQMISADSTQATGIKWSTVMPTTAGSRNIPVAGATSGKPIGYIDSPMAVTSSGALQNSNGSFNGRGTSAVDLQPVRGANTEVASGNNSVIGGGQSNTAAGSNSTVAGGTTNTASNTADTASGGTSNTASGGNSCVTGGNGNTASGQYSTVAGGNGNTSSGTAATSSGNGNTASGNYSTALGNSAKSDKYGQLSFASGDIASAGDAQAFEVVMRNTTTNATPTLLFLDGSATKLVVPAGTTWAFDGIIVRRVQTTGASRAWYFAGVVKNVSGTVTIVGSSPSQIDLGHDDTNASFTVTAGSSSDLALTVTGASATNYAWVARVRAVQVSY